MTIALSRFACISVVRMGVEKLGHTPTHVELAHAHFVASLSQRQVLVVFP